MLITKPKLSLEGQIEHLKEKGVLFNIMDEESAKEYFTQHNNYFKLTAYTLLYMHKTMVESDGIIQSESEELQKIMNRIDRNYGYYSTNPMIKGTFDFLKLVVDNWF